MANNDIFEDDMIRLVNKHSEQARIERMQQADKIKEEYAKEQRKYSAAEERSIGQEKIEYGKKKKKSSVKIDKALLVVLLAATMLFGAAITDIVIDHTNVVIPMHSEYSSEIDQKIDYYVKQMGYSGPDDTRIETAYGRNVNDWKDLYVDYQVGNLVRDIIEASKISETEVRCVLVAAYRIVNVPYREQVFGHAFSILADGESFYGTVPENMEWLKSGNVEGVLKALGYDDWDDYAKNERGNIKELYAIQSYVEGGMKK